MKKSKISAKLFALMLYGICSMIVYPQWTINQVTIPNDIKNTLNVALKTTDRFLVISCVDYSNGNSYLLKYDFQDIEKNPKRLQFTGTIQDTHRSLENDGSGYIFCNQNQKYIVYKIDKNFNAVQHKIIQHRPKSQYVSFNEKSMLIHNIQRETLQIITDGQENKYKLIGILKTQVNNCRNSKNGDTICYKNGTKLWYKHKNQNPVALVLPEKYTDFDVKDISSNGEKILIAKVSEFCLSYTDFAVAEKDIVRDIQRLTIPIQNTFENERIVIASDYKLLSPIFFDKKGNIYTFSFESESFSIISNIPHFSSNKIYRFLYYSPIRNRLILDKFLKLNANENSIWHDFSLQMQMQQPESSKLIQRAFSIHSHYLDSEVLTLVYRTADQKSFVIAQYKEEK